MSHIQLPTDFLEKMQSLLGNEFTKFKTSLQLKQSYGLRLNTLKCSLENWLHHQPFNLREVPWVEGGFFYDSDERPGKHPYHAAGLYYIQEPSAMAVVELMDPKPGERILDLAAAPGGKSTHIAQKMAGEGLLVANDIHSSRARALSENIERLGIQNTVVLNEAPDTLAKRFPTYFDRILVDAPCSGEGMFRKNERAIAEWSLSDVQNCALRQEHILAQAAMMLKPGGQLVYSTCTFSPEENEQVINEFVKSHPDFSIETVEVANSFQRGRAEWVSEPVDHIEKTVRLWPHHLEGEGHFIALLRKDETAQFSSKRLPLLQPLKNKKRLSHYKEFVSETLNVQLNGNFVLFGDEVYLVPKGMISFDRLKVIRAGWHLGTNKKNRFEPSHALALALSREDCQYTWDLQLDDPTTYAYLRGETFSADGPDGWYVITVDGFSLGWGKLTGETMKNHYPKGLRWMGV